MVREALPDACNELMSGSPALILVWRSSKLTDGRKSKDVEVDDCEISRLLLGAKLSLVDLCIDDCLECVS